jgi:hypothetical protein
LKNLAKEDRRTLSAYIEKLLEDHVEAALRVKHRGKAKQKGF